MELERKIALKYLYVQYHNAKKYFEKEIGTAKSEDIEAIIKRFRNAGAAYAQAKYCVFMENGSFGEDTKSTLDIKTHEVHSVSLYDDFIKEMELYIVRARAEAA